MNIYIFKDVAELTENYHSGGGLVVIAKDIHQAVEMAQADGVKFSPEEIESVLIYPLKGRPAPQIFIFQDAGCC